MQFTSPRLQTNRSLGRTLGYFLIPPVVTLALVVVLLATGMALYRTNHSGRVYTGVTIQGIDVGGMTVAQYLARLAAEATTIINAEDYGRAIYDLAIRRNLILIGEGMVNVAYDAPVDMPPRAGATGGA